LWSTSHEIRDQKLLESYFLGRLINGGHSNGPDYLRNYTFECTTLSPQRHALLLDLPMKAFNSARFSGFSNNSLLGLAGALPVNTLTVLISLFLILPIEAAAQNIYGTLPDFTLTDSENMAFQKSDLKGKVWLAHTFFTSCPSVCPTIIADIKQIISELPENRRPSVISITVDPKTDSTARLSEYRSKRGLKKYNWKLLTGAPNAINSLIENGLHLSGTEGNPDAHSPRIILIDEKSNIRGYYLATDTLDLKRLKEDLLRLSA
jgi:protein SCO1/2